MAFPDFQHISLGTPVQDLALCISLVTADKKCPEERSKVELDMLCHYYDTLCEKMGGEQREVKFQLEQLVQTHRLCKILNVTNALIVYACTVDVMPAEIKRNHPGKMKEGIENAKPNAEEAVEILKKHAPEWLNEAA